MPESGAAAEAALSPAQRRLWFLHQLDPNDPAYHICLALELRGPLNVTVLRAAAAAVARRHEVLRSTFVTAGSRPYRRVAPTLSPPFQLVDLTGLPAPDVDGLLDQCARRPFDLAIESPGRWYLLRFAPTRQVLVFVVHHIVFDGGCLPILCRDLEQLAEAFVAGRPAMLPDTVPTAAPDAAVPRAGKHPADKHLADKHLAYWRDRLADPPPPTMIWPPDPDGDPGPAHRARTAHTIVDGDRLRRLQGLSRRVGATPFITLLATLAAVVARYTGQDDVVMGSPVSTREPDADRQPLDLRLNLVALRIRARLDRPFAAVVRHARDAVLDALDHHGVPFEHVVDEVRPHRTPDVSPLFQVLFAYQHAPVPPRLPGVAVTVLPSPVPAAKYHLTVTATESPDRIELAVDAPAGNARQAQVIRFLRHLTIALDGALTDPDLPVGRMPLTRAEERVAHRSAHHHVATAGSDDDTVHGLVERMAATRPDAIAVDAGTDGQLTYGELDRRANRLAHELRARTPGPLDLVAVHLPRTPDLIIAMIAVLKAGAAYLPLDSAQPPARLRLMLGDAHPAVLVTTAAYARDLAHDGSTVRIDTDRASIAHRPHALPRVPAHHAGLAYVLYTSGSTGRPKGVAIEHRSAVAFLRWSGATFGDADLSRTIASTSVGFDLSIFEIFGPLTTGGTVVLTTGPGTIDHHPGTAWSTLLNTVPSVLETLLNGAELPPNLTTVNLAGEPLRPDLVDRLLDQRPGVRVANLYGPSEATTYATGAWLRRGLRAAPIGEPVAAAEVWLADPAGEPVPAGVVGEILIGGGALARGYLNQPGRTADLFVPDHLGARPGARLYRTGDLARLGPDGGLLFLGRRDNQVKVRGVRIELEEVETILRQHDRVRDAAVAVIGDDARHRQLAAVVCPLDDGLAPCDLVDHLRTRVPAVMTPARWAFVEQLPRTPNGKLDRRAVEATLARAEPVASTRVAPRTDLERAIADVWREVLAEQRVGVHDAFFDVGGNSLLLLELHARLRDRVDPTLRVADLFRCPTIAALANLLRDRHRGADSAASRGTSRAAQRLAMSGRRRPTGERAHGSA